MFDDLVHILEPGVGSHVVEVGAHGEHDVVGPEVRSLKLGGSDKG